MATVYRLLDVGRQFLDDNGDPYAGGLLFTYTAGSSTKKTTYQEASGSTPHANPIVLDANGRLPAPVWGTTGAYKLVLAPSTDTDPPASPEWTEDDVSGINDTATSSVDQWVASGLTPTYVSGSQFSVSGDRTTELHAGRRLKTANSGGTIYSSITASSYSAPNTTVTVVSDSGSLDAGLSSVSYGLLSATGHSLPIDPDATNVGYKNIPQNSQSGAYGLVLTDAGKHILHPAADTNARTFTIPANASVAFAIGTAITFVNETANVLSIAITTDTLTLAGSTTTGTRSLAQNGIATALKVTSTKWIISGTGLT
jgi:hypothetical protein